MNKLARAGRTNLNMKKEIAKLHIFHGENDFDREENVRQWISAFKEKHGQMNLTVIDSALEEDAKNTFARAVLEARTSSLFSGTRLIVVKIEDLALMMIWLPGLNR